MILESTLSEVVRDQHERVAKAELGLIRTSLSTVPELSSHAFIITGIRRSGKSTLLFQLLSKKYPDALYLNFEDPRLYGFDPTDFIRLDNILIAAKSNVLLFDEPQVVTGWEVYIRKKLDEGFKVVVTGSNASLLSRELGTKLTGRHISRELFPFSYTEFISYKKLQANTSSLEQYLLIGGFPSFVKEPLQETLQQLFDDILIRDIAIRYGVRDIKSLKRLAQYLISNVSKLITANRLKSVFEMGSANTIAEYLSHLEYAYLFYFIPKFSYSHRKQAINARKVYSIDTGMINAVATNFTKDDGRKFENLIFIHLRRVYPEIYYFQEKGECDFLVFNQGALKDVVQVCYTLTPDNLDRELNGIIEALTFFNIDKGTIVTLNQTDQFEKNGKVIEVLPADQFCSRW